MQPISRKHRVFMGEVMFFYRNDFHDPLSMTYFDGGEKFSMKYDSNFLKISGVLIYHVWNFHLDPVLITLNWR